MALAGKDVCTPILQFRPPTGVAFFGPAIRRLPKPDEVGLLWDHVLGLASFPGSAELERSLRTRPALASFGVDPEPAGVQVDLAVLVDGRRSNDGACAEFVMHR